MRTVGEWLQHNQNCGRNPLIYIYLIYTYLSIWIYRFKAHEYWVNVLQRRYIQRQRDEHLIEPTLCKAAQHHSIFGDKQSLNKIVSFELWCTSSQLFVCPVKSSTPTLVATTCTVGASSSSSNSPKPTFMFFSHTYPTFPRANGWLQSQ